MKKALIFDLDNTIYPVSAIEGNLFEGLFLLIDNAAHLSDKDKADAKYELTRRPYHLVADQFNFGPELKENGNDLLKDVIYELPMLPFKDYHSLKATAPLNFLVTTGFTKLQWSKVKMLGIENDFNEIHVVDPILSSRTKKDVFADILTRHNLNNNDVMVIGDDPESEIKAAAELGIETFLFDPAGNYAHVSVTYRSASLKDVLTILS